MQAGNYMLPLSGKKKTFPAPQPACSCHPMPPNGQTTDSTDSDLCPKNFGNFRFGNDENMNDTTWKYVKNAMFFRTLNFDFFICKSHLAIFSGGNCVCVQHD